MQPVWLVADPELSPLDQAIAPNGNIIDISTISRTLMFPADPTPKNWTIYNVSSPEPDLSRKLA
jgi:hypothetical protein